MNGCYSLEILALFIEDDLPPARAEHVNQHLRTCAECRGACTQLETSQVFIKSGLRTVQAVPNQEQLLARVRHTVLSKIESRELEFGWRLKIERFLWASFRKPRYALASIAILIVVSAAILAQMRHTVHEEHLTAAVFDGTASLAKPQGYRDWVFVGSSKDGESLHNIYVEPAAYRHYARTGTFPEGTVLVREKLRYGTDLVALEASVKDSGRFPGGWGFFDFTDQQGKTASRAQALPDTTCRSCHEQNAETDHVFTQYYPVLRFARMES